jgi:ATP-binding cassette, subfamily B, multidrug efflux pump
VKSLLSINKYFWKYKYHFVFGSLFIIISNLFAIIPAQLVRYSVDYITDIFPVFQSYNGMDQQKIFFELAAGAAFFFGILMVIMALLRGFFLFLMRQTIIVMSRHIEYDQKNEIYAHYQSLPLSFFRRNNTGDLMVRISEDVGRVRMYTGPAVMYGVNLVVLFVLVIGYMVSVSPALTFYSLLPLPVLSASIYFVNTIISKRSEQIQNSLSQLSKFTQEAFSGIRVLKAFAREADNAARFNVESNEYRKRSMQLSFVNALFFPLMFGLIGLSTILTIYYGGLEVNRGNITTGNIAEFVIYINMLTWPVTSLGWVMSIAQRSAVSQTRINEFLDEKTDIVSLKNLESPIIGAIRFNNVSFTYPYSGIQALKNVSFAVKPGECIAIMGTTGSGKSTVANLLARMYDPTQGLILIDEVDARDYNIGYLRKNMAQVPQDVFLFSDSIASNVAFGFTDGKADESKVIKAVQDADFYENLSYFPEGLATKIGERGITLSGGQKQRVSIARALILDPKILVLDDSLSAVDTKTENAILNNLKTVMQGKTTVIISHRISSAKLADHIIFMDEGYVVQEGTHEELIAVSGMYRDLYEKQLTTEVEG